MIRLDNGDLPGADEQHEIKSGHLERTFRGNPDYVVWPRDYRCLERVNDRGSGQSFRPIFLLVTKRHGDSLGAFL
jgi:hypothetical protein